MVGSAAHQLLTRGYAVFESLHDDVELSRWRALLAEIHAGHGAPPCYSRLPRPIAPGVEIGRTGFVIAKLLERRLDLAAAFLQPPVVDALREALGQDVRIELTAAILADASRPPFPWHTHIGGQDDTQLKLTGAWPSFVRPRRIGTLLYLEDLDAAGGPLVLMPRTIDEPTGPVGDPDVESWPGEVVLTVPRGTVVALDECTWHSVRPRTAPGLRTLLACNYVATSAPPSPVVEESVRDQSLDALLRGAR